MQTERKETEDRDMPLASDRVGVRVLYGLQNGNFPLRTVAWRVFTRRRFRPGRYRPGRHRPEGSRLPHPTHLDGRLIYQCRVIRVIERLFPTYVDLSRRIS
jgi:hypothetical protein